MYYHNYFISLEFEWELSWSTNSLLSAGSIHWKFREHNYLFTTKKLLISSFTRWKIQWEKATGSNGSIALYKFSQPVEPYRDLYQFLPEFWTQKASWPLSAGCDVEPLPATILFPSFDTPTPEPAPSTHCQPTMQKLRIHFETTTLLQNRNIYFIIIFTNNP